MATEEEQVFGAAGEEEEVVGLQHPQQQLAGGQAEAKGVPQDDIFGDNEQEEEAEEAAAAAAAAAGGVAGGGEVVPAPLYDEFAEGAADAGEGEVLGGDFEEEQHAGKLRFGRQFTGEDRMECVMNDELLVLLTTRLNNAPPGTEPKGVLTQTLEYVKKTALSEDTAKVQDMANELRVRLDQLEFVVQNPHEAPGAGSRLHEYEIATLGNLLSDAASVEETVAWIPSLRRFAEEDIQQIVDTVTRAKEGLFT